MTVTTYSSASASHSHAASGTVSTPLSVTSSPFAFAQIRGEICLVQLPSPLVSSPLMACDVRIFRHELITIFRYSYSTSIHPSDIQIIEFLDERTTLYEEDKETIFLSREAVARMQQFAAVSAYSATRQYRPSMMAGVVRKVQLSTPGPRPSHMARMH